MEMSIQASLARKAVEEFVINRKRLKTPNDLPDELTKSKAGAFVSLKKNGHLRGCIGTIEPQEDSLAEEIITNAISACSKDPRFYPVQQDELEFIEYSVDVLFPPEKVENLSELDVKRYGVIVEFGGRRGLLLPDLEGVDNVEQQVSIAMNKAGIMQGMPIKLYRFEVVRYR